MNRQEYEVSIPEIAGGDLLTQLGNRYLLKEDLEVLCGRAERYGHTYAVVLCEVDDYALYVERNGQEAGDRIVCSVASAIKRICRRGDSAYRVDGPEFVIVLPEQSPSSAVVAVERIRTEVELLSIPRGGEGAERFVTISAGITMVRAGEYRSASSVVKKLDEALLRAKEQGPSSIAIA